MKHLTILLPDGQNNLSSIVGVYKIFNTLKMDFHEEYKFYKLSFLAIAYVTPIIKELLATWNPLKDPTLYVDVLKKCKPSP